MQKLNPKRKNAHSQGLLSFVDLINDLLFTIQFHDLKPLRLLELLAWIESLMLIYLQLIRCAIVKIFDCYALQNSSKAYHPMPGIDFHQYLR